MEEKIHFKVLQPKGKFRMEIRNILRQQWWGGWEDVGENDRWTRHERSVCVWLLDLPNTEVREVQHHCFSSSNSSVFSGVQVHRHGQHDPDSFIEKQDQQDSEADDSYFAVTGWCILIISCSLLSVWSLHVAEAAVYLIFSLRCPPCTLIFCHVVSWLRSLAPVLQPWVSSLRPLNYLFLPSPRIQSPSASPSPLSSHLERHPASLFSPLLHLRGFLIIQLGFFPFRRSAETILQQKKKTDEGGTLRTFYSLSPALII